MNRFIFLITMLLMVVANVHAQISLSGVVTDGDGLPVPGTNVVIKGTLRGTVTDLNGKYYLVDVKPENTIIFSCIGMLQEEVVVGDKTQIDISLIPDIMNLESVVVVGYGEVKKKDLTGSVVSVSAGELTKTPTSTPLESLQGKVTGMDIIRTSGSAGAGVEIRIRGNRTIERGDGGANNEPLIIIDGIQGASMNDLNPNDIESISILKDASSTAIYGYQGANGVILITTKRGNAEKSKISYSGYFGLNGFTPYPAVRLGDNYIEFRKEAYRAAGLWDDEVNTEADYPIMFNTYELDAIESNQWVNWQNLLIRNGIQQSHLISYSGGNEKTTSYFSAGYFREQGILVNDELNKYTARMNIDHKAYKWMTLGMQSQVTYYNQDRRKDPLSTALSVSPLGVPFDDEGNIILYPVAGSSTQISPLTDDRENVAVDNTHRINAFINGYIEIKPIKGLMYRTNIGTNTNAGRRGIYQDATSLAQKNNPVNTASVESNQSVAINLDNIASYSKLLNQHNISFTVLSSYIQHTSDFLNANGINQANPQNLFYSLSSTDTEGRQISSGYTKSNSISFAGRFNYTFNDKYLLSVSNRFDGASVLAEGNKWDNFPAVSAAWKMNEENFIRNKNIFSNLKLRISYGISGNASISPYQTQSGVWAFPIGFGEVGNTAYKFNDLIGNESLGWEKSATSNVGIDVGILKNRFNLNIDVYNTKTNDIILQRDLPRMTGIRRVYQNIGSTQNRGIELLLKTLNVSQKNFTWTSNFTFSRNDEKITDLINGADIIQKEDNSLFIGYPINTFYTFHKTGIWQSDEEEEMDIYNYPLKPGDIKLEDTNNDSIIDADDRKVLGSAVPKWFAGLENTFTYKSFELSIYLFARWGQMIDMELLGRYNPSATGNGPAYFDYWTPDNPTNDFPRPMRGAELSNYFGYQALPFVDGSYFKIKNIRLSYTIPVEWAQSIKIQNFQCYVSATNLLTITKSHLVQYYDPERGGSESAPLNKQFVFGINVDF